MERPLVPWSALLYQFENNTSTFCNKDVLYITYFAYCSMNKQVSQ